MKFYRSFGSMLALATALHVQAAVAQTTAPATAPVDEETQGSAFDNIVVTAQKREQNLNSLGMTVTAITGANLLRQGVGSPADLVKLVPGFTYIETPQGTPVYTLRGVGYVDETLSASPAVSVYVDEVPLPFTMMTRATTLDLERVEVLKGPQGTLFGENSTGGAFNYIAAKPQEQFGASVNASYGRFNTVDVQGHVTGPLAPNLNFRVAGRILGGDDWQKSYTRIDTAGRARQLQGRLLLDWKPTDRLSFLFNANGWLDKSDTQAPQLVAVTPQVPALIFPELLNYPLAPRSNRAADWSPERPLRRDDSFFQLSLRADYEIASGVNFTSISAFGRVKTDAFYDGDGTAFEDIDFRPHGFARSFYQEARVAGDSDRLNWIVGANYSKGRASEVNDQFSFDASNGEAIPGLRFGDHMEANNQQWLNSRAVFANVEFRPVDAVALKGGVRYTHAKRRAINCFSDRGNGNLFRTFEILADLFNGPDRPAPTIGLGGCIALDANFDPGPIENRLDEDNVSWHAGIDLKPTDGGLLFYGNISKGYKAGTIGALAIAFERQAVPVTQEALMAYEAGFKAPLFDRTLQLNAAFFYYDYKDKQLLAKVQDPVFGILDALTNIPRSRLYGVDADLNWRPVDGLTIGAAATYLKTRINEYVGIDQFGTIKDYDGSFLPYSPKWQVTGNAEYQWPVANDLQMSMGGTINYQSRSSSGYEGDLFLDIDARTLIDLRAGLSNEDDGWNVQIWGRNITNTYYWTSSMKRQDTVIRYAGRPATYGITFSKTF